MHSNAEAKTPAFGRTAPPQRPSFSTAFRFWLKLGFISFGGPTGQIAIMHTELVERRRWISEARFLHALNFCMLLPGPEAMQLATYVGWLLHGVWGGIVAGTLFVLPSALILWVLSYIYVAHGSTPAIAAVFAGLQPAVVAIVAAAVLRIGSKVLKNPVMWTLAAGSFVAIFFFKAPFPAIVFGAGLIGFIAGMRGSQAFLVIRGHGDADETSDENAELQYHPAAYRPPTLGRAALVLLTCCTLWFVPILGIIAWLGRPSTILDISLFFSKAAMVTFGGAYAVLPYVAQQAVERYGWLSSQQMLSGLGLAESTPGPLIMVLQFVGFVAGWRSPGSLSPLVGATLGAALTTWVTFVPCFLWIFLGAPYVERLRQVKSLQAALSAITAAVVGVVLNLAVWFGMRTFAHGTIWVDWLSQLDWFALVVATTAFAALTRWKVDIVPLVVGAATLGLLRWLSGI